MGDKVYLKLQPYVQSSLGPRANQKLAFKIFGPYEVVSRVGSVAYKLALPPSSSLHPVFHVSQLKKALLPEETVVHELPPGSSKFQFPESILDRRTVMHGVKSEQQILVKWYGMSPSLSTWESLDDMMQQFPRAPAWGQAGFHRRGNVSKHATQVLDESVSEHATQRLDEPGPGLEVTRRVRRPNVRVSGDEWIQPK